MVHLKALYLVIYLFKVIRKISLSSLCNLLSKFPSVLFCFFPPFLLSFLDTIYHPCLFDFLLYPYFYPAVYPMKSHSYSCDCVQNYYVFLGYSPCSWYLCAIFKGFHQIVQLFSCVSPSPYCSLSFLTLTSGVSVLSGSCYHFNSSVGFCSWPPTNIQVNSFANHRGNWWKDSKKRVPLRVNILLGKEWGESYTSTFLA